MSTVQSVSIKQKGTNKKGKPWTLFEIETEDGQTASGFDRVKVGDNVNLHEKGDFLNYSKADGAQERSADAPEPRQARFLSKDEYWSRKERKDADDKPRIERQHSQHMALLFFALNSGGKPVAPTTKQLRDMISWFCRDIGHTSSPEVEPTDAPINEASDQEEPF